MSAAHPEALKEVGSVLLEYQHKYLLVQESEPLAVEGKWNLPGGEREADDSSIEETAIRECREETGLVVKIARLLIVAERPGVVLRAFEVVTNEEPLVKPQDPTIRAADWFTEDQIHFMAGNFDLRDADYVLGVIEASRTT